MRKIISVVVGIIIFFFLSKSCISDYLKGGDKKAIANYEKMLSDGSRTTAILRSRYTEVTVKIMGAPMKAYEFKYDFRMDGKIFSGNHTFSQLPTSNEIEVYYLTSNPSINCVDPKSELDSEKEKNTSKSSLYWGIGWGILGLFAVIGLIAELRETKSKPEVEQP